MTRDDITVQKYTITNTTAAALKEPTMQAVTQANGIRLKKAFECQHNTLTLIVQNTTTSSGSAAASTVVLKKGDKYPNSVLGDLTLALSAGKTAYITIQDPSRFVDGDGAIKIDFGSGFTGNIAAIGRPTGIAQ